MAVSMATAEAAPKKEEPASTPPPAQQKHSPYRPSQPDRVRDFYRAAWGIDDLKVQRTASGSLIRFSYLVVDSEQAKVLGDKQEKPQLIDFQRGVMLEVPIMDKVGQLRQTASLEAGRKYWMAFSNKGDVVKAGDRVNVVIGVFHADGLIVE
jgi:hypothetical protein